jgi:thiosulfate/3-mercaptopyruvate sulfurtransferase
MSFALAVLLAAVVQPDMIVSTDWLAGRLNDPNVIVVEIGERPDFQFGDRATFSGNHIPGSRFISRHEILVTREGVPDELPPVAELEKVFTRAGLGNQSHIVIYSSEPLLASRMWFTLDYLGHGQRASILDGGLQKWRAEGRRVEWNRRGFPIARFTANVDPSKLITRTDMASAITTGNYYGKPVVVVDARPPYQYMGWKRGAAVAKAGHIPEAECFPWTAHLTSDHPRVLRDDTALREMYASVGATKESRLIVYCRTGVEASMNYFVLRHLGYDVVLYDGSYVEWSKSPDAPVTVAGR